MDWKYLAQDKAGVHKYLAPERCGDCVSYGGAKCLWILSIELASCHSSGS
jgi:hypothetical protein